jgi:GAF domain-containing protein
MKEQGHQIKLAAPKSLVARAARHGNIVTTENVGLDPDWLPNPLLPHTHAEMAVPIALGAEIVGVLDVQSENVGGLTVYDEVAMQALANQVAVAVRNARLFSQTQQALQEAHQLQELYTSQAWEHFRTVRNMTEYEVRQPNLAPLNELDLPEALAALQQAQTVVLGAPLADRTIKPALARPSALATPLKLRNQVIGVLGLHDDNPQRRWSEDEIALIEAVSEQMTLALENARLFEDTQRSAWRDQMVSEATAKVWSAAQMEEVLKAAVAQLGDKLGASEVVIRLGTEAELVQE